MILYVLFERRYYKMFKAKKGNVAMGITGFVIAVGAALIAYILVGVMSGQIYQSSAANIAAITDTNIKGNVTAGITSGFNTYRQTADYTNLYILGIVTVAILGLVMSLMYVGRAGGGSSPL
jgi:hypothetical protein